MASGSGVTSEDLPQLPGFLTVPQAANHLGLSLQGIYYQIYHSKIYKKVYRVGGTAENDRPFILIEERDFWRAVREAEQAGAAKRSVDEEGRSALAAWHMRVKAWARNNGWTVNVTGPPRVQIREAYVEANPQDPRPVKDGRPV